MGYGSLGLLLANVFYRFLFLQLLWRTPQYLAFGIFDDDTTAVLKSVWSDFPILKILLTFTLLIVVECFLVKLIYKSPLLEKLAQQIPHGILFKNFMLSYEGTIASLEGIPQVTA